MSRVAATEWGCDGININVVCPLVMTAQLEQWREEYPEIYLHKHLFSINQWLARVVKIDRALQQSESIAEKFFQTNPS